MLGNLNISYFRHCVPNLERCLLCLGLSVFGEGWSFGKPFDFERGGWNCTGGSRRVGVCPILEDRFADDGFDLSESEVFVESNKR